VITTRTPIADIADHERTSALRRGLDQLSTDAGAKLLRALGVKRDQAQLRSASDQFGGHCLALTLLGSYLTDAYHGDIRRRSDVSGHLGHDLRHGAHARKVMESHQSWLGEGPELAILRMLGLFDRPAELSQWHLGEMASCQATMAEAIALAKELNDMHALAQALRFAGVLGVYKRNVTEVERLTSDLIEVCTRQNFAMWLLAGNIFRGWARSTSGDTAESLAWIEDGISYYRASRIMLAVPFYLALKAEALPLSGRTSEALEAITEAEALTARREERWRFVELHRLRGVFLTATGASETQIETSLHTAIRTAREQKSVSLQKRAEATYAEYRRQKASGSGFRLPLC